MAERYKVGVNAREGENVARKRREDCERKEDRRGEEEEGPAFQSPVSTRDPRPLNHPPQLGRNSVLFSPLLCSFLLFSSLRDSFFFFIYFPSLFRPFLPDCGDNRPTLCLLLLLRLLLLRPPMFLQRVLTGENCGKNVVDLRDPLRGWRAMIMSSSWRLFDLDFWLGRRIIRGEILPCAHQFLRNFDVR